MRSAAGYRWRRTWQSTGRVVAGTGTPEGYIGPDGAEGLEEGVRERGRWNVVQGRALERKREWVMRMRRRMERNLRRQRGVNELQGEKTRLQRDFEKKVTGIAPFAGTSLPWTL